MKTIGVVLPVYNEEAVLPAFNAALLTVLDTLRDRYRFRIVYVLDRSQDNSFAVLGKLASKHPDVTVLHLSWRFGHQQSLVAGIDYCQSDAVIMMDCDLQHPPEVIPELLQRFEDGFDIVHTARRYDSAEGRLKRLSSHLFYKIQNLLSPVGIEEGSADFRLISRKVAAVFQRSIREQNPFLRGLFRWVGFSSTTVQFVSPPRTKGATKYRPLRLLAFSIHGITSFSKVPLRIATLLGLVLASASFAYGAWIVGVYFAVGRLPPGYASLIVLISFIGGLQLLVLGALGEYIGGIFDEVKRRPLYVIDEIVQGGDHGPA